MRQFGKLCLCERVSGDGSLVLGPDWFLWRQMIFIGAQERTVLTGTITQRVDVLIHVRLCKAAAMSQFDPSMLRYEVADVLCGSQWKENVLLRRSSVQPVSLETVWKVLWVWLHKHRCGCRQCGCTARDETRTVGTENVCVADELAPGGRRSSALSGTSVKRRRRCIPPPRMLSARCSMLRLLLIWGIHLHYSAALRLHRGYRMRDSESGRMCGREMVDPVMEHGHHAVWCLLFCCLLYEASCAFHCAESLHCMLWLVSSLICC